MIWLYLAWFILLVGSSISYYIQYPNSIIEDKSSLKLNAKNKETLALNIVYLIAKEFENGKHNLNLLD